MIHDKAMDKGVEWSLELEIVVSCGFGLRRGDANWCNPRRIAGAKSGKSGATLSQRTRESVEYEVRLTFRTCWGCGDQG